ncbi:MAG: ABC transporter ATP-binding protein [Clostridia bacterium]|nr:ABC transporter ATP-binding protein [Clostridia bacterium]
MVLGKHINRYYLRFSWRLLIGIATLFAVDYLQLVIPNLYQMLINGVNDGFVETGGERVPFTADFLLDKICLPMVAVILSIVVGRFLWRVMFFGTGIAVEKDLRDRMFDNARFLSREYYQVHKVGDLMSLFTNDLDTVQECFAWGFMMFFDALLLGGLSIGKMFRMNAGLTLLSLIPMGLLLCCATVLGKYMMKKWDVRQAAFSKLSDFAQESFSGVAVIKAFVKESRELMAFGKLNRENEKANVAHTRASVLMRVFVTLFVESVICIILGYGGYLVYKKVFNAGLLMEFIGYFSATVWPIMAVSELIDMTSRGKASLNRIGKLLDAETAVKDRDGAAPIEQAKGEIEFRNLTFTYPDGELPALTDVSFKIEAGQSVGVVGRTGCGKTTLAQLILRCYNVPDGTLFVDGKDVNGVTIKSLRDNCAYVPQDNFLFSDTIENNIAFGVEEFTREDVEKAAALSDVDKNISEFTKTYDTVLGERGVTVSGGQKQRISIARALMKDAPILILDDAVSAVDTDTEKRILENLEKTREGRTTVLIAHRISTVRRLDRILYLDDGRVAGFGDYDTLYAENDGFRRMVDLQKLEEGGEMNA